MKVFAQRMKKAMDERRITQSDLASMTGLRRSSISQYLSGKNEPRIKAVMTIADALNVPLEWLTGQIEEVADETVSCSTVNLPIRDAAKLMGVGKQFVRKGLQDGKFPFGYAIKITGNRFTYYISPRKFTEYTGIEV